MIEMHFNLNELTKLSDDMLAAAKEKFPRKTKAFMGRAGNRMRAKARAAYKADIKHSRTGNLVRGLPADGLTSMGEMNSQCVLLIRLPMPICLNMGMFSGLTCPVQNMLLKQKEW